MMLLRVLERVHGHLGWLSAAALLHPAIVLRNPRRRARGAALSGALVLTLSGLIGAAIYREYGRIVKRPLFTASHLFGELFERKEHLAVAALALAWAGFALHMSVPKHDLANPASQSRARAAHYAFVASAVMTTVVSLLGTAVSSFLTF